METNSNIWPLHSCRDKTNYFGMLCLCLRMNTLVYKSQIQKASDLISIKNKLHNTECNWGLCNFIHNVTITIKLLPNTNRAQVLTIC
jgi:hypothetical protein